MRGVLSIAVASLLALLVMACSGGSTSDGTITRANQTGCIIITDSRYYDGVYCLANIQVKTP